MTLASQQPMSTTLFDHITSENLTLRIAETPAEIEAAQRLRYDIFYREMGATATPAMMESGREIEAYDPICDHLIVVDEHAPVGQQIIGTYRMLLQERAEQAGMGLYTETEFDISKLKATGGRILEISRSCIHPNYRSKAAINLLWKGIAAYVFKNNVDYLVGVPSFEGTDLNAIKDSLAYLNAYHATDDAIRPVALPEFYHALPVVDKETIDPKKAFFDLPPLLKGYIRIGCTIGEGCFIDTQFNTVDVCIVLHVESSAGRYLNHYRRYDT